MKKKLGHLNRRMRCTLRKLLYKRGVISMSLDDLRPTNVPFKHSFESKNPVPIHHKAKRLLQKQTTIVKSEVERILRTGVIRPVSFECSFTSFISMKKDRKPRFFVDHCLLNQEMKVDCWLLPKPQEILDGMKGSIIITRLDFFTGYWQFLIAKHC